MTIEKAINLVNETKPSQVSEELKTDWLSRLDRRIFTDILQTHEHDDAMPEEFEGYTLETPTDTELLAPEPYDEIYRFYLEMQIDLVNLDMDLYENSLMLYTQKWDELARMWHRTHQPISQGTHWRF